MTETFIYDFNKSFYKIAIKKVSFNLSYISILGNHHCVNTRREEFKHCGYFQDVLCFHDYAEQVVASFAHQIQSEYYGGNRTVYIEGIVLENFSDSSQPLTFSNPQSCTLHAVCSLIFLMTENSLLLPQLDT